MQSEIEQGGNLGSQNVLLWPLLPEYLMAAIMCKERGWTSGSIQLPQWMQSPGSNPSGDCCSPWGKGAAGAGRSALGTLQDLEPCCWKLRTEGKRRGCAWGAPAGTGCPKWGCELWVNEADAAIPGRESKDKYINDAHLLQRWWPQRPALAAWVKWQEALQQWSVCGCTDAVTIIPSLLLSCSPRCALDHELCSGFGQRTHKTVCWDPGWDPRHSRAPAPLLIAALLGIQASAWRRWDGRQRMTNNCACFPLFYFIWTEVFASLRGIYVCHWFSFLVFQKNSVFLFTPVLSGSLR